VVSIACPTCSLTISPAQGQYLFYSSNSSQFFIRGVAYQQGVQENGASGGGYGSESNSAVFNDPLADSSACARDIPYLQSLGTNTIRVYAVDPTKDHDACMKALDDAGIYVIADLSSPAEAINRANPQWTTDLYQRYTSVIQSLGNYTNVIGFFAGNEVTNNVTYTASAAFVKAAVRDCKAYIKQNNIGGGRWLGVGYATNDDQDSRDNIAKYFNCGDASESVDFYGYNIYEWCGQQTFQTSGYQDRTQFFQNWNVPVFFAEYGCQTQGGAAKRIFQETGALYSSDMNKVWSGGIVYEYFEETNDYGNVT
jgi:1,3-beta-glucanosyltransferase GAS1